MLARAFLALTVGAVTFCAALPARGDFIYWSTITGQTIRRARLDGSGMETILSGGNNAFGGIAFDVANGHLYSGDRTAMFLANLDGSGRTNLVTTLGGNGIGDVEIDPIGGKIYWTEGGVSFPLTVRRANLDGTQPETIKMYIDGDIEGLAVNPTAGKLYYAHNRGNAGANTIEVSNLDGTELAVFRTLAANSQPYDVEIDVAGGKLYWNEYAGAVRANQAVRRANLGDSSGATELVLSPPNGMGDGMEFDPIDQKAYIIAGMGSPDNFTIQRFDSDGSGLVNLVSGAGAVNYIEVLHAVPEPASWCLALIGALAATAWRQTNKRRA